MINNNQELLREWVRSIETHKFRAMDKGVISHSGQHGPRCLHICQRIYGNNWE